jgi:hypothetical protein
MPVPVTIEGLQIFCFGLAPGGMLIVARPPGPHESVEECREDLESIGAWLSGAIEASLGQPNAIGVEPYRIVSFRRILREATVRGSLRKVSGAFVEALGVWDDVRVAAYVSGAMGGFFQYVSTMTAPPSSSPDQLDEAALPRGGRMCRLTRDEADRLGLSNDPGDTLILRFTIGSETEWVLVFSGMIDVRVEVRLRVYSDILRESLNEVLTTTTSRVIAEVSRRPLLPTKAWRARRIPRSVSSSRRSAAVRERSSSPRARAASCFPSATAISRRLAINRASRDSRSACRTRAA